MSAPKKTAFDKESVLLTLDQMDQTIEVMTDVIGRLRNYLATPPAPSQNQTGDSQTFHIENKNIKTLH